MDDSRHQSFRVWGDVANVWFFLATAAITYGMLYRFPNESYFDASWLEHGFCVTHPESQIWNSHALSFYSDAIMSVMLAGCYYYFTTTHTNMPPLQQALLWGAIPGVFFHGTGHLYLSFMDPSGMDLRWNNDKLGQSVASQLVTLAGLVGIYQGTLALASMKRIFGTAILSTVGLTVLNIPPTLNFVYVQGIIYVTSSLHMLTLERKHKQSAVYLLYPLFQFPVLAVGVLECTRCQQVLTQFGGHAVFDTAISVGSLMMPLVASHLDNKAAAVAPKKKVS